jgi:serine/threonine protein kinase/tetratricopeptide (TPR) repeat protein
MTPERWLHVKEVFTHACALDALARNAYLADACAEDSELRRNVDSLIVANANPDAILDYPVLHYVPPYEPQSLDDPWLGKLVGAYQLVACIGRGGMGAVYRARRADAEYENEVAIKLVRAGFGTDLVLQRFRAERQILANLGHPNIARLLDGGATESGEPFLVLELVDGEPIDEYCDKRNLPIDERLNLFREVCTAVSHAHRHLVVHRDLKPANILVTAEGVIKLLDFGIAKLLQAMPEAGAPAEATQTSLRAMTPAFSSPEQILGLPVTTASDVYSLGVVLYHLLAGCSPYRSSLGSTRDAIREVCETEPLRPSMAAAQIWPKGATRAQPDRDLDYITLRALRKEPDKRYSSVEQFSEDLRRYLTGLPVIARGDRLSYRAGKFWGRHRFGVTMTGLVAAVLVGSLLVTLREARIAEQQSALAAQHFASVRQLANTFIFQVHDSIKDLPGATPARDLLVSTALKYLDTLASQARSDRGLQRELAQSYARLGDVQGKMNSANTGHDKAAIASYSKALALYEALERAGPADSGVLFEMAKTHRSKSHVIMMVNGDPVAAARESQQAIALASTVAKMKPDDAAAQEALGDTYGEHAYQENFAGHYAAADAAADKAVEIMEAQFRLRPTDSGVELHLINSYVARLNILPHDQPTAATIEHFLTLAQRSLEFDRRRFETTNNLRIWRDIAVDWNSLGILLGVKGDWSAALDAFRAGSAAIEHTTVDAHNAEAELTRARLRVNLARALIEASHLDEAQSESATSRSMLEGILKRTDTYEVQYLLAHCEEELGSIEMQRALAAKNPKQQLHAWQSAHAWFAKSVPRFEPILKVASLNIWDRPPTDRAFSGLTRSTAEIHRLED